MENSKPKPIVLVTLSTDFSQESINGISKQLHEKLGEEYHVLAITSVDVKQGVVDFQVFFEKDFNQVKYKELKELITDKLRSNGQD